MHFAKNIILLLFLLFITTIKSASAQQVPASRTTEERIIFKDNLDNNRNLESRWAYTNDKAIINTKVIDELPALEFAKGKGIMLEAKIKKDTASYDQVTFDCDYLQEDTGIATISVFFSAINFRHYRYVSIDNYWLNEGWKFKDRTRRDEPLGQYMIPLHGSFSGGKFHPAGWHHLTIVFTKKGINIFLDGKMLSNSPQWGLEVVNNEHRPYFMPNNFSFGGASPYAIKNVSFIENKKNELNTTPEFKRILSDKKFVTHDIHFNTKEYSIKPESIGFIKSLSDWLKKNPTVRLEIDGHTDADGDTAMNLNLSKLRAEEVKKQLINYGVDNTRLSTKGYGLSRPLKPNNTSEGKVENRRVEFIKL